MADGKKLIITSDELPPAAPQAPASTMPGNSQFASGALPTIQGVKPPTLQRDGLPGLARAPGAAGSAGSGSVFGSALVTTLLSALLAVIPAWALFRAVQSSATTGLVGHAAVEFAVFGAVFGALFAASEHVLGRVWEKAFSAGGVGLLVGAVSGAVSGAIAQEIYGHIVTNLLKNVQTIGEAAAKFQSADFYLTRALGWAIFGLGIGVVLGAATRSLQRTVNGVIGGVIGGALGGLFFHWIGFQNVSEPVAQLLGLAAVGVAVGLAIGLIEVARRQAWIKIVAGGMTGKEFIVYHAATNVGASPKCQITLIKDPQIAPFHFRIEEHGARRSLAAYDGALTLVNGQPITQHWLRTGDVIQAGQTAVQYQERAVSG